MIQSGPGEFLRTLPLTVDLRTLRVTDSGRMYFIPILATRIIKESADAGRKRFRARSSIGRKHPKCDSDCFSTLRGLCKRLSVDPEARPKRIGPDLR